MKNTDIILRKNPLFERCPSCSNVSTLHRSRTRNWKESFFKSFSFYKIYRCDNCGWRGYLSTITITSKSILNLVKYMFLALLSGYIAYMILSKFIH